MTLEEILPLRISLLRVLARVLHNEPEWRRLLKLQVQLAGFRLGQGGGVGSS
jgi:hypothetical protein